MLTWERCAYSVLRVLGLSVTGHDVALLSADHELGWPRLRVVLQAAVQRRFHKADYRSRPNAKAMFLAVGLFRTALCLKAVSASTGPILPCLCLMLHPMAAGSLERKLEQATAKSC